jgi:hypothetical protein
MDIQVPGRDPYLPAHPHSSNRLISEVDDYNDLNQLKENIKSMYSTEMVELI